MKTEFHLGSAACALPDLPLYLGLLDHQSEKPPRKAPFALGVDETGLVRQTTFESNARLLSEAYRKGTFLSTLPGASGYAKTRTDELLAGLGRCFEFRENARVLEIGAGTGLVLSELVKEHRVIATGIDPGVPNEALESERGIRWKRACFTATSFPKEHFDLIYSSMVLEHVADPLAFLEAQWNLLAKEGVLFVAVPDCEAQLLSGDPNLPCHQHASYFSAETLMDLFRRVGATHPECRRSESTASLHIWATKSESSIRLLPGSVQAVDVIQYLDHFHRRVGVLQFSALNLRGKRLGLAGISLGAAVLSGVLDLEGVEVRLFDTDPEKIGRFLPGVAASIQHDDTLRTEPVDELWVLPTLHSAKITTRLHEAYKIDRARIRVV